MVCPFSIREGEAPRREIRKGGGGRDMRVRATLETWLISMAGGRKAPPGRRHRGWGLQERSAAARGGGGRGGGGGGGPGGWEPLWRRGSSRWLVDEKPRRGGGIEPGVS